MTIQKDGTLVAVFCDGCGQEWWLDAKPDDGDDAILAEIEEFDWKHYAPEKRRFKDGLTAYTETYERDLCEVCRTDDPAPKPVTKPLASIPKRIVQPDAFANDPCDEWPRAKVWEAVGLRGDCGHPKGPTLCAVCGEDRYWPRRV